MIALDPDTGKELWRFDPKLSTQNAANFKGWAHMTCRGVAYHDEAAYAAKAADGTTVASPAPAAGSCPKRLFVPTADTRLIALDADTRPVLASMGQLIERLSPYGSRLEQACRRVVGGETKMFTGVMCGSYHDVWMELHEDLILTQRVDRAEEGSF